LQADLFARSADEAGAIFDEDRVYRYVLWRRWGIGPAVVWIMLNPSTADETDLDPTLRRCQDFTMRWGHPAMVILNLYGLRSTDPKGLWEVDDPYGPDNLRHIEEQCKDAALVVLGWGTNAKPEAVARVLSVLRDLGVETFCLRRTKEGHPEHPLYLPKRLAPVPWHQPGHAI